LSSSPRPNLKECNELTNEEKNPPLNHELLW